MSASAELLVIRMKPASAVFAVATCPSVCPSVRHILVYCIQMAKDIVKLLYRPDSPIILVF